MHLTQVSTICCGEACSLRSLRYGLRLNLSHVHTQLRSFRTSSFHVSQYLQHSFAIKGIKANKAIQYRHPCTTLYRAGGLCSLPVMTRPTGTSLSPERSPAASQHTVNLSNALGRQQRIPNAKAIAAGPRHSQRTPSDSTSLTIDNVPVLLTAATGWAECGERSHTRVASWRSS